MNVNPLHWPAHWPRTIRRQPSQFSVSLYTARVHLLEQLERMGARDIIITSNAKLSKSGVILGNQSRIDDPGVAVYFSREGKEVCVPCDRWETVGENLRAIGKSIEALRGLERWGAKAMVDAAFTGFAALPEQTSTAPWWIVLGVANAATRDAIERAYREKARVLHPDAGGSAQAFMELTTAYERAVAEQGG